MTFTNMKYRDFEIFVDMNNVDYKFILYNNKERNKQNRLSVVKAELIKLKNSKGK